MKFFNALNVNVKPVTLIQTLMSEKKSPVVSSSILNGFTETHSYNTLISLTEGGAADGGVGGICLTVG